MSRCARWLLSGAMLLPAEAWAQEPETSEPADEQVVITGSRQANASINGLSVDPLLLPQNVRVLDEELIDRAGFTDLS
jgi:iron complex outermembrane recepter protein